MESKDLEQKQSSSDLIEKATVNTSQEDVIKNNKNGNKASDVYTNNFATVYTIQNSADDKGASSVQKSNLRRNNSTKSRISKSLYLQLHRQASYPSTSTVDRLKDRYEATDNGNTAVRSNYKVNSCKNTYVNLNTTESVTTSSQPILATKQAKIEVKAVVHEPSSTVQVGDQPSPEQVLSKTQSNIEKLQNSLSSKLSTNTIQHLRNKYSPASFGYPKGSVKTNIQKKVQFSEIVSKTPIPTPRVSTLSKEFESTNTPDDKKPIHSVIVKEVSLPLNEAKSEFISAKDENSNIVSDETNVIEPDEIPGIEIELQYGNIKFAEPEDKHFIVRRCSSEDSIEKLESFLSDFIMDKKTKERKRSNSFRRLLTGGFFGKDKKKTDENRLKNQKKDNAVSSDNAQNESQVFDRNSTHRHTVDSARPRDTTQKLEDKPPSGPLYYYSSSKPFRRTEEREAYTEMSNSGSFLSNRPPKYSSEHYLPMGNGNADMPLTYNGVNRYLDTSSSSSNTIDYDTRNCTYQNALIAQHEIRQIRENQNQLQKNISKSRVADNGSDTSGKSSDSPERFRESPLHTSKNVQLVKPKALIPINSERPLPNPYHNKFEKINNMENYENLELSLTLNRNLNLDTSKPYPEKPNLYSKDNGGNKVVVDDVYGTVFDSISPQPSRHPTDVRRCISPDERISLSPSKLKLPPNREKVELQPRLRSPIPQAKVSTDKIIATELLRSKRSPTITPPVVRERSENNSRYNSPTRPSSYQGSTVYENAFQFPSPVSSTPVRNKTSSSEYIQLNQEERPKPPKSYLQAAEWHKTQRELDKSPAIEAIRQVTTDVLIHTNPLEQGQRYSTPPSPAIRPKNPANVPSPTRYIQQQTPSPKTINSPLQVQIQHNSPSPTGKPAKQEILQNVEAFYWRELRKLKDKEEQDLFNYRHRQMQVYGYIEDPVLSRRSRSISPGAQRGRRSLSLPRDSRPMQQPTRAPIHNPEPIPEGRPVIAKRPIALPTDTRRNPNFIRNTFERSTIGPIGLNRQVPDDFQGRRQTTPIFKRGSLTAPPQENPYQMGKKVSFSSNQNPTSWPTKNGFTKSPPTRRVDRETSLEDDVFLPSPRAGEMYVRKNDPMQYNAVNHHLEYVDGRGARQNEPLYGNESKKITVSNKVCDIYGQIHDSRQKRAEPPRDYTWMMHGGQDETPYGHIRQSGLVYGQLQGPNGYNSVRQVPQQNFVRGTRLTASVNDMYNRRYPAETVHYVDSRPKGGPRYFSEQGPQRPLPPVPERHDSRAISVRKLIRGYVPVSDNESGSEAGEVQRILRSGSQQRGYNVIEEEWNSDGKSGRASGNESGGGRGENEGEVKSGRSRSSRRDDPRRHTLSGDQHYNMAGQGGPLSRTMDLEGQFPRGYPPSSNPMLFDDDPGIMSEVETSSTGFRRGGKQRSSLPVVRTPSKTLERPLGLVFLQYRNETKRALLPNEITSIDTVKALFVRSFPKQLSMEYLDSPLVKIYIHDSSKDMFYELEDVRSHLREIRDRSVLRLFESTDVSGGLPMGGVGIPGGVGHFEDPSYFSEPEFDSEYQHQHIHKSKGSASKGAPYYMGSTTSLPRSGPLLRPYSPAVGALPPDRLKSLPAGAPPKPQRAYSSGTSRSSDGSSRPPDRFAPFQRPNNPLFNLPDGYMSSPERGSRGYEDPYYSQYTSRSGSITPVIDEEVSDTELLDEQYSLYGVKLSSGGPRGVRSQFPGPAGAPYDTTRSNYNRLRVEHMERQLANLTGLVQKALTQTPTSRDFLAPPGRDSYRSDKSVSFEKSVSFSDEPPDMNSPKQHSPQHAEKDRLKPAPPPKPASLSPGQYDGRHIYRDLQLTPEMYNQLRGLQKKAKDLRAEVRNLRRMSQAQAHSVKETIRDTFIKIRAMLMAGGEQVWQAGMDQERIRLSRDEDLYKQEMIRLEKDLTDLEASVEELRGNVINRKTRVNMSDVENMALVLSKSSKTVADLKLRFPGLQDSMKAFLSSEMDNVVREEKFLKEEPERLESALRRCKKLTGTLVTLKRLASVQEQRLPCSTGATDGRISPSITETPPITPNSAQHSKPPTGARVGQISFGGDNSNTADGNQRPENALDALLDELQTFSKPHPATVNTQMPQTSYPDSTPSDPPAIPIKGIPPSHSAHFSHPHISEVGRKGSMDSAVILPTQNLTVTTTTGSLRRLHSYPSGSDTDNSPPIQPLKSQLDGKPFNKPPIPERNADLFQHISGKRVPPPPPPRTSSKSPLASPTSPNLPPRSPATGLQHIQNVQNVAEKPQSQFEAATQNLGLSTLRRNVPNRSSIKDNKAQTLPRNIGSNLQIHTQPPTTSSELQNVSSSSCESVNSQDGSKKGSRKEELEQRHQELLKKQRALQEQYARLQQLQRGNNTLAVVPPAPDQLLKKTGSESNLLQKMGLQLATTQMTGSLTHLPSTTASTNSIISNNITSTSTNISTTQSLSANTVDTNTTENNINSSTNKVYETDIL